MTQTCFPEMDPNLWKLVSAMEYGSQDVNAEFWEKSQNSEMLMLNSGKKVRIAGFKHRILGKKSDCGMQAQNSGKKS